MPPIYSYQCTSAICPKCGKPTGGTKKRCCGLSMSKHHEHCMNEFDVLYTSHGAAEREEPTEACPKCGDTGKERLVSTGTSFVLKGSGWAKDRYSK